MHQWCPGNPPPCIDAFPVGILDSARKILSSRPGNMAFQDIVPSSAMPWTYLDNATDVLLQKHSREAPCAHPLNPSHRGLHCPASSCAAKTLAINLVISVVLGSGRSLGQNLDLCSPIRDRLHRYLLSYADLNVTACVSTFISYGRA